MDVRTIQHVFDHYYKLFPKTSSIAIANLTHFIYYRPSAAIDLKIKQGDAIHKETVTYQAITQKRNVKKHKGNSIFGVAYFAVSEPIVVQGRVVGAITAIFPKTPVAFSVPYVTIRLKDRFIPVHFDQVIFLEAQNRKTYITSTQNKGVHRYNLTELEMILPADLFLRCHRSYIVNVHQINEIHPDSHSTFILIMSDDSRVPVSQGYARQLRSVLSF